MQIRATVFLKLNGIDKWKRETKSEMNSGSQKSRIWGEMTGRTWTDGNSFYSNWTITLAPDYFNSLS